MENSDKIQNDEEVIKKAKRGRELYEQLNDWAIQKPATLLEVMKRSADVQDLVEILVDKLREEAKQ